MKKDSSVTFVQIAKNPMSKTFGGSGAVMRRNVFMQRNINMKKQDWRVERMKLVIEISKEKYEYIKYMYLHCNPTASELRSIILNGTPLPKGHGRIIDESKITSIYYHEEKVKQGAITAKAIFIDGTDAPTIAEADGGEK